MKLNQLRKQWHVMSRTERLELIEKTNERRIEAFSVRITNKVKKTKTTKRRKTSTRKKSPSDLFSLLQKMTPEQRENFKLMAQLDGKNPS